MRRSGGEKRAERKEFEKKDINNELKIYGTDYWTLIEYKRQRFNMEHERILWPISLQISDRIMYNEDNRLQIEYRI